MGVARNIEVNGVLVREGDIQVSHGNLYVHNAQAFDTVNGNGNIVVGDWSKKALTGSHNILVGDPESVSANKAESYGGIISGYNNSATAEYAVCHRWRRQRSQGAVLRHFGCL